MRKTKARLLAIFMTLVMMVGLLPVGALAINVVGGVYHDDARVFEYHLTADAINDIKEHYGITADDRDVSIVFNKHTCVAPHDMSYNSVVSPSVYWASYTGANSKHTPDEIVSLKLTFDNGETLTVPADNLNCQYFNKSTPFYELSLNPASFPPAEYAVSFDAQGGLPAPDTQRVLSGETATEPTPAPEKDGFDFLGWYAKDAQNAFDFSTPINAPLTLTAKWEKAEEPVRYPYTMSLEYYYGDNAQGDAVSAAVLSETAKNLAIDGVTFTVSDGHIDLRIAKSALTANNSFDYGAFVFDALSDKATLTNKGQDNKTETSFDANGGAIEAPKLLYKKAAVAPTGMDAWFFIRTDGLVPLENGSTGYPSNQYLPAHDGTGGLPGIVLKANSWSENYGPIVGDTISGIKLSEAFAKVQEAIAIKPTQSAIDAALAGVKGYDPETQGVMWYVVKNADKGNNGCPGYHVDGVLYTKGSDPAQVRVLTYYSNIPGNNERLAYAIFGLGAEGTVGDLVPVREGYDFVGWNTDPKGEGDSFQAKDPITMDKDYALYAQWKLKEAPEVPTTDIEIFHFYVGGSAEDDQVRDTAAEAALPNGGTVSRDYKGITKEYVNGLNTLDFYKDDPTTRNVEYRGYMLYAYDDNGAGGDKPIVWDGSSPLDLTGVKTLRIHLNYYQTRYSVVYKANGGTGADVTKYYNTAAGYTVLDNAGEGNPGFTRADYTFSGWAKGAPDGENVSAGAPGTALEKNESVTYYARWTKNEDPAPITYGVTYEYTGTKPDGTTPPVDAAKYEAGAAVTLATAPTAPANYTFTGWTLPEGVTVENGKFSMPDHAVTITGNWTYTAPSGGGDSGPTYRTVTVNYLEQDSNKVLADAYTLRDTYNSTYDVSAQAARAIDGYAISSTNGETSGRLLRNLTINVYYTAVEDIPEENPPLGPGPDTGDNGGTDIPDEETPLAPLPDTGDNGGTTGDDTVIEEENPPLGNLPQTGTTAQNVNPALTLGALALALSMAAAGLTISLTRKKEEEN